ncbi:sugar ABC transporter substrate-binding protein [Georgenia sp. Z1344]|uniref:sugar ABC transporter substrate-binding protein n=1 Tax=Georgenia sp. Z1344 TaxID=3416706 RepID=UPI003CF5F73D
MRRSITTLAATAAVALTLAACGGGDDESSDTEEETSEETSEETGSDDAESGSDEAESGESESGAAGEDEVAEAGAVTPNEEGTLVVWVDETRQAAVEEAAVAFEEETGVEVQTVLRNFEDIRTDFVTQVPTGEGPDITVGAHDWLGELTVNGVVAPLELTNADDFEQVAIDAVTYDGQIYGLPFAIENIALIRNTELAPEAPATWDDALAAGEEAGTEFPILIQSDGENGDPYTFYPLQTSFGAPVFVTDEEGAYTEELGLGGEGGAAFAQWLAEQGENGTGALDTNITYDIAVEAFANGESPFIIGGPWMLASFEDIDVAIDPIPAPGPEAAVPFAGVQAFFVNAQSPDALIANDFLVNFMSTEEAQTSLFETGDRVPALTVAADAAAEDEIVAGFREVGAEAAPMPALPAMGQVWQFWGVTEGGIISGAEDDPAGAWEAMVADIQGAIDAG